MSSGIVLTQDEIEALTGRHRKDAQVKALRYMGIEHRVRPDGSIAVLKAHIDLLLGGTVASHSRQRSQSPNWAAIDA